MHLGASFGIEIEHPIIGAVPLLRPLSPALPSCASHSCNRAQWLSECMLLIKATIGSGLRQE
jgi:hypothetical protein